MRVCFFRILLLLPLPRYRVARYIQVVVNFSSAAAEAAGECELPFLHTFSSHPACTLVKPGFPSFLFKIRRDLSSFYLLKVLPPILKPTAFYCTLIEYELLLLRSECITVRSTVLWWVQHKSSPSLLGQISKTLHNTLLNEENKNLLTNWHQLETCL